MKKPSKASRMRFSLSTMVALVTMTVTATSMGAYAVLQYITVQKHGAPDVTALGLVLEHGWHVLALGAVTYLTLHVVLSQTVAKPIRTLYLKLYGITRGDHSNLGLQSRVEEVHDIAEGISLLLRRQTITMESLRAALGASRHAHAKLCTIVQVDGEQIPLAVHRNLAAVAGELAESLHAAEVAIGDHL